MYPLTLQIEIIFQTVLLLLALLVPVRSWSAAPAALLCALALHTSPSVVFVLAGWLWWKRPGLRWTAVWLLTLAAAMAPWTVRTHQALGQVVFVRDNLPLELYVSNNGLAGTGMRSSTAVARFHPNFNREEAESVRQMGEAAYMKSRGKLALAWIRSNQSRFAILTLARTWSYWFPSTAHRPWQGWLICLVTIVSLPAIVRLWRHPVFFSVLVVSPLVYYVIQADTRYRLPYLWMTLLAAGWTITWLADNRTSGWRRSPSNGLPTAAP